MRYMSQVQPFGSALLEIEELEPTGYLPLEVDQLQQKLGLHYQNRAGDLSVFLSALAVNASMLVMALAAFSVLRLRYPKVYANNVLTGRCASLMRRHAAAPLGELDKGYLAWVMPSWNLTTDDIERCSGLDAAMLIEFTNLCIKILAVIGFPMVVIMCPLHRFCGGMAAGDDLLSRWGMRNLQRGNWLYLVHAVVVWLVVMTAQSMILTAQQGFLKRRFAWLRAMPPPRSTTILVEHIPKPYRTDRKLQEFFRRLLPEHEVASAYVVRRTARLVGLRGRLQEAVQALKAERFKLRYDGRKPLQVEHYEAEVEAWRTKVAEERSRLARAMAAEELIQHEQALSIGDRIGINIGIDLDVVDVLKDNAQVHTSSGFVTFAARRGAVLALGRRYVHEMHRFTTSIPPDPSDVIYADLQVGQGSQSVYSTIGYVFIVMLFFLFLPITIAISMITSLDNVRHITFVDNFLNEFPSFRPSLEGVLASLGLTLAMNLLPSLLMHIFHKFFVLKANEWAQHKLQIWYFWFLVIFVVLITAVGASLWKTATDIIRHPLSLVKNLAQNMPQSTHFYLNYMSMQWVLHGVDVTRYVNLTKFVIFRTIYEEDEARRLSEPENQVYHGIGARSAHVTTNMVIALVFCQLSPLITLITAGQFVVCRVVYGYLVVFAESRKPDLGGVFWITKLHSLQQALVIYILLMIGVLVYNSTSDIAVVIAASSLVYLYRSYMQFRTLHWESLPMVEVADNDHHAHAQATRSTYEQPEFSDVPSEVEP